MRGMADPAGRAVAARPAGPLRLLSSSQPPNAGRLPPGEPAAGQPPASPCARSRRASRTARAASDSGTSVQPPTAPARGSRGRRRRREVLLLERLPVGLGEQRRWISAIASVSSCPRCSAEPLPGRDEPHRERRAGVRRPACSASRANPAAHASSSGSISACSASIASSVSRPSASPAAPAAARPEPGVLTAVVVVQHRGEAVPALGQRPPGRRSSRPAWCRAGRGEGGQVAPEGVVHDVHHGHVDRALGGRRSGRAAGSARARRCVSVVIVFSFLVGAGQRRPAVSARRGWRLGRAGLGRPRSASVTSASTCGSTPVEPGGEPPVPAAEQRHRGRAPAPSGRRWRRAGSRRPCRRRSS